MSPIENILTWLGGGFGVGGGVVGGKWFLDWLGGRVDRREIAAEQVRTHIDQATKDLITTMSGQIKTLMDRQAVVDQLLAECREQHHQSQQELAALRGLVTGFGDAKNLAQVALSADRLQDARKLDPDA